MGDLTPVLCKKIVPGDRFRVSMSSITRLAPLANPVYDRVRITYDAFFVQNRIVDPDWKDYVSPDPEKNDNPTTGISLRLNSFGEAPNYNVQGQFLMRGGLLDMLGFQFSSYGNDGFPDKAGLSNSGVSLIISAIPILGYFKIWDNWYRNERFQPAVYSSLMDGGYSKSIREVAFGSSFQWNYFTGYGFLPVNYGKDLFTTALESPLIGGPVNIPAGSSQVPVAFSPASGSNLHDIEATISSGNVSLTSDSSGSGSLVADMKNAVLGTIQELKFAYALFSFYMKDTYNGNRYVEFMQAHFGVCVPDSTLERSLFLGRITQYINFSEIFQTSGSTAESNSLGDYAGVGVASGAGRLFDSEFDEHGFLYVLMSIRPNATYFQGIDRKFFYGDRFDELYFPEFQNIGDKPIFTFELYNYPSSPITPPTFSFSWKSVNSSAVFGYNRANAEYLWYHDEMHGNFLNLNGEFNWTFARRFDSPPVLGSTFSRVPVIQSPFTFTDADSLNYYTDIFFDIKALRPFVRYEHY